MTTSSTPRAPLWLSRPDERTDASGPTTSSSSVLRHCGVSMERCRSSLLRPCYQRMNSAREKGLQLAFRPCQRQDHGSSEHLAVLQLLWSDLHKIRRALEKSKSRRAAPLRGGDDRAQFFHHRRRHCLGPAQRPQVAPRPSSTSAARPARLRPRSALWSPTPTAPARARTARFQRILEDVRPSPQLLPPWQRGCAKRTPRLQLESRNRARAVKRHSLAPWSSPPHSNSPQSPRRHLRRFASTGAPAVEHFLPCTTACSHLVTTRARRGTCRDRAPLHVGGDNFGPTSCSTHGGALGGGRHVDDAVVDELVRCTARSWRAPNWASSAATCGRPAPRAATLPDQRLRPDRPLGFAAR